MSNTLKVRARSFDAHPQTPAHGLLGHRLPKLALDRRTNISSAHGAVSRRQHADDRSLNDSIADFRIAGRNCASVVLGLTRLVGKSRMD